MFEKDEEFEKEDLEEKIKNAEEKLEKLEKKAEQAELTLKRPAEWKSEETALVLAIVGGLLGFNGIGHMYAGKIGKGIGILIGSIILLVVGVVTVGLGVGIVLLIFYVVIFFWQIFNARKLCREYNQYLETNGQRPW